MYDVGRPTGDIDFVGLCVVFGYLEQVEDEVVSTHKTHLQSGGRYFVGVDYWHCCLVADGEHDLEGFRSKQMPVVHFGMFIINP